MNKVDYIVDTQGEAFTFHCPGCDMAHFIPVSYERGYTHRNGKPKPVWRFNGDSEKPTFIPAFSIEWVGEEPPKRCHAIIRDGELIFLIDSTHKLSGARVKMKDT